MDPGAWRDIRATLRVIPRLHVVTDDEILARPDFEALASEVCEALETDRPAERARPASPAGRAAPSIALHLRGPRTTGRRLIGLARILHERTEAGRVMLLVNDRLDVALAVGAAGAHLGSRSIPPADARRLLGHTRQLGVSVHSESEAVDASESGASYVFLGPLFETPSHPGVGGRGADFVRKVALRVEVPVVGIGGVTPERAAEVVASGAHGVAAIRGIWDAPSPPDAVQAYLDAVERTIGERWAIETSDLQ